jgi:hypothetical protein
VYTYLGGPGGSRRSTTGRASAYLLEPAPNPPPKQEDVTPTANDTTSLLQRPQVMRLSRAE